MIEKNI